MKRRPRNKLDTEYKGPYRVVSEDAATRWRVLELANPASGRKHWENTSNLVQQPKQPVPQPEPQPEGDTEPLGAPPITYPEIGLLRKGQLVAFEAALPKGVCSPYGWNLAEIVEVDAGD